MFIKIKYLGQGHIVSKWQRLDRKSEYLLLFLNSRTFVLYQLPLIQLHDRQRVIIIMTENVYIVSVLLIPGILWHANKF